MVTHSSILAWRIQWAEKTGGPQCMESLRVRLAWATEYTLMLLPARQHFCKGQKKIHKQMYLGGYCIRILFTFLTFKTHRVGKKKKSLDYCDSRRYAYRLVLLLLYASQWKWASHLFKDSSMHPSQIYWIGDFHWLCFSKHQFRLTASSHISINAIHNKSTRHSKALGAVVWKLSDS